MMIQPNTQQTIQSIQWYSYATPLISPLLTAHEALTLREGAIVELFSSDGTSGIGEIAPLPEFGGGTLNASLEALPPLAAQLRGRSLTNALTLLTALSNEQPATTLNGLECALLDLLGQHTGLPLYRLLQPISTQAQSQVAVNAVIGSASLAEAVARAMAAVSDGFRCLKLKMVGSEQEQIRRVAEIRAAFGDQIQLRLDANEGWNFAQARFILDECAQYQIAYVEQPLPAEQLEEMYRLRRVVSIPVAADEAVTDLANARRVLSSQAADILVLKPQLLGGLRNTQQIIREAQEQRVQCVITSTIETGTGVAAALHLAAAMPQISLPCGLATLPLLQNDLLLEGLAIQAGQISVPQRPGLGIQLNRDALNLYRREKP